MGNRGIQRDEYKKQYIAAIYFVTTTVSTCGFGDISATKRDGAESATILMLQFIGMLFYSMTVQKVQSYLSSDKIPAQEFANHMVEMIDNLIVKVGRQLPTDRKIPGKDILKWKHYTYKYFSESPNAFLAENEYYQDLPSNLKKNLVH